jgi:hypothetical protein
VRLNQARHPKRCLAFFVGFWISGSEHITKWRKVMFYKEINDGFRESSTNQLLSMTIPRLHRRKIPTYLIVFQLIIHDLKHASK